MIDFKALGAKAASEGADQTKAVAGGGADFATPAAGPAMVRFIGYVELGKQKGTFQGKPAIKEKVELIFELVGKRHPPNELPDGTKVPVRMGVTENYSLNEKANFFKLFQRMNYKQEAQHIVQLLGEGFKAEVIHDKWTDRTGKERVTAVFKNAAGYTISPPRKEDEDSDTGWVNIAVPPALSDMRCFLWEQADMTQWGSLFIDGSYPERKDDKGVVTSPAKSKNLFQNKIKSAVNFIGSPMHTLLVADGQPLDLPSMDEQDDIDQDPPGNAPPATAAGSTSSSKTAPSNDALGGIV